MEGTTLRLTLIAVAANALWISGCALALATFSYASLPAVQRGERLRDCLGRPGFRAAFSLAAGLICAGLAATSQMLVFIILWGILGALFCLQAAASLRQAMKD
jgi:hypothetical protein